MVRPVVAEGQARRRRADRAAAELTLEAGRLDHERLRCKRWDRPRLRHRLARDLLASGQVWRYLQDRAAQRPLRAEAPDESARVDARDTGHTVRAEVRTEI